VPPGTEPRFEKLTPTVQMPALFVMVMGASALTSEGKGNCELMRIEGGRVNL
jgi:hypothetical protein